MAKSTYDYDGDTVIVTGGSSGIGRAIATRFGAAGATVINADLDPEPKDPDAHQPTYDLIRNNGGEARFIENGWLRPDSHRQRGSSGGGFRRPRCHGQ